MMAPTPREYAARIAALEAQVAKLKEEAAQSDEMYEAQWKKFEGCPHAFGGGSEHLCACSFDKPDDECAVHAPKLREALTQVKQLREALGKIAFPGDKYPYPWEECERIARAALAATEEK